MYLQRVILYQVPGISLQLSLDIGDYAGRPVDMERKLPAKQYPQERVETYEVVDMGMGDEGIGDPVDLGIIQGREIACIKKHRPSLAKDPDEKTGVAERIVEQSMVERGFHEPVYVL
jgi:hypothetical protein